MVTKYNKGRLKTYFQTAFEFLPTLRFYFFIASVRALTL